METKRCPDCGDHRPVADFYRNRSTRDGLAVYCRDHMRERQDRWRAANPEKWKQVKRKSDIKSKYGLSPAALEALMGTQGHACAVCSEPFGEVFHIDHCHETGAVRGVLHPACNQMLGQAFDNPARLRQGAAYLERIRS